MTKDPEKPGAISCFRCGAELVCGAVNGDTTCWCDSLPNIMPLNEAATSCYCRNCLELVIDANAAGNQKSQEYTPCKAYHNAWPLKRTLILLRGWITFSRFTF